MKRILLAFWLVLIGATGAYAGDPALRAGVVPADPPFVLHDARGHLTGFSVALFRAIAVRMKRDVVFTEAALPALQSQLTQGQLDVLAGPIPATPERAAELLFVEGYVAAEYQFGARTGTNIAKLSDLSGKRLAVHADSEYAEWASRNAERLGFSIAPQSDLASVFDAVRSGRADVSLTGSADLRAALNERHAPLVAGLSLPETRTHQSAAVATTNIELRDEIEDALRCLKQDGSVAKLAKAWFGTEPGPEDLENLTVPGYGVPDLEGYDPKIRKVRCSQ
jgi:polar amino acid transport system substrate-binding protein